MAFARTSPITLAPAALSGCAPRGMTAAVSADETSSKECPRCTGRGKYADPARGPLVQITCERCEGSGRVPVDSTDEAPAKEPTQIPFGSTPNA